MPARPAAAVSAAWPRSQDSNSGSSGQACDRSPPRKTKDACATGGSGAVGTPSSSRSRRYRSSRFQASAAGGLSRWRKRRVHARNSSRRSRPAAARSITRSAPAVSGSSQDSHLACRPRRRNAPTRPASSAARPAPSPDPANTMRGWKRSGRASFMPGHDKQMHAIEVSETGGPEVLRYVETPRPTPRPGEVLIKAEAIGVNYIDTYFRSGQYPRQLPFVLGSELAGTVEALGDGVDGFSVGDRVVSAAASGGYAEYATAPASLTARVPDGVSADVAASALLKGLTAH